MSNYHILTGRDDGNAFTVAFHLAVPNVANRAGVNVRAALVNSGIGGVTIMAEGNGPGQIAPAEKVQIQAGELFEHVEQFATNPGENATQLRTRVDARYVELVAALPGKLVAQLSYFGFTRDVT